MLTTLHHFGQMDILDRSGDKIGRIRDVLLDTETGRCDYLLISTDTGPFTGFGGAGSMTPIPLSLFTHKGNYLTLDATRDVIKGAPSFSTSDVSSFSADYREKLDRFWGVTPGGREAARERTAMTGTAEQPLETRRPAEPGEEEPFRRTA